jgi:hypothetical protein
VVFPDHISFLIRCCFHIENAEIVSLHGVRLEDFSLSDCAKLRQSSSFGQFFSKISSLAERKLTLRLTSVDVLFHGGRNYDEQFSCGCQ